MTQQLVDGGAAVLAVDKSEEMVRTELIDEEWNVDGVPVTAQMWRRPISAVFTSLLEADFTVDAVAEPRPELDERTASDARIRTALNTKPVFLFVRALRNA